MTPDTSNQPDNSVEVVPYSDEWPAQFEQARAELSAALGDTASSIEHIGSTAVPGMAAKPTIDILVVVDDIADFLARLPAVEALGWDYRAKNTFIGSESHLFLRKVVDGKRTHHLHVVRQGSSEIEEYRLFRDELCANPALAADYEEIKWRLAREHAHERGEYVLEKKDWVGVVLERLRGTTA